MIIRRSRRLVINVAQYESIDLGAEIEFDPKEIVGPLKSSPEDWANAQLNALLEEEIEEAAKVTSRRNSFINEYRYTEEQED